MSKSSIFFAVMGVIVIVLMVFAVGFVSISNKEVDLRTTIEAKQKDNTSEFDNMWKKISQVVQVTDEQKNALVEIFNGYAKSRNTGGESDKLLMKWVQESVPNVDLSVYKNLQNIIISSRDSWTMRQKELVDLSREHTTLLRKFPSGMILSFLGRKTIEITIITSSKTTRTFETGKDDDVELFKKDTKIEKSN